MNRSLCILSILLPLSLGQTATAVEVEARVVAVSGRGEVRAAPDLARIGLGVQAHGKTAATARAEVNRVVPELLKLAHALGVKDSDLSSTRLSVTPDYEWDQPANTRRVVGYTVERRIAVELHDLDRLGELLEKAISAGANAIDGPELDSSKRRDLEREALSRAVADARLNAGVLAAAAGRSVGAPRQLTMTGTDIAEIRDRAPMMAMKVAAPNEAASTYQAGELTFSASVQASFDLAGPVTP